MGRSARVYVKTYQHGDDLVVAACDEELIGALIEDSSKSLRLYVDPAFFKGELRDTDFLVELLSRATIANLVGRNAVEAAIRAKLVHAEAVLNIKDTPIALFARF